MPMTDFTAKWEKIDHRGFDAGRFRVLPDHPLDLFVAYSPDGNRQFMFQLPNGGESNPATPQLENIATDVQEVDGHPTLVLTLQDRDLSDLFSVICIDLAGASESTGNAESAASIFMTRLDRWSDLLRRRRGGGMSLQERLGLLGELMLIKTILDKGRTGPGQLMRGWRGPDGDATDIAINGLRFEVKAQLATAAPRLRISSLDQLDAPEDNLVVVWHRFSRADAGPSLGALVHAIGCELASSHRDQLEFQRKLLLSGFDPGADYVDETFSLDRRTAFRVSEGFPRLVRGQVPEGITEARYEIACSQLTDYEIHPEDFEEMIDG